MGKYGDAAINAVKLLVSGTVDNPKEAWEIATSEIFGVGTTSQQKSCPQNAFLGLCEEGLVKKIPPGNYTKSKKNKEYAIKAVKILHDMPELKSNPNSLWNKVLETDYKVVPNQQMDVVTSLWGKKLIVQSDFTESLFEIAKQDLKAAKCLFDKGLYPQAVFYLQQSVEKANKSWAIMCNVIKEEEVKAIGHDPFKVYVKILKEQKDKLELLIERIKKFPKLQETKLLKNFDFEKHYKRAADALTNVEKYYKVKGESLRDIKFLGEEFEEILYTNKEDIISIIEELDSLKLQDYYPDDVKISKKEFTEIKRAIIEILDVFYYLNPKKVEKLREEVEELFTTNLLEEAIKVFRSIPMRDIIHVSQSLYYLSLLMLPHSIVTRYPDNDYNPLTIYNKNLPLIQLFGDMVNIVEKTLFKLGNLFIILKG